MKLRITTVNSLIATCIIAGGSLFIVRLAEIPELSAVRGWDNSFYVMWVRSAVIDHDIHFANEIEINNTIAEGDRERAKSYQPTSTGYIPNKYGIGWGLASAPFFILADVIVIGLRVAGWESLPRDGYNFIYQTMLQLGQLAYAILGLYFAYRFCSSFFSKPSSLLAVLTTWICSMLLYYQSSNLSMAHSLVFALVATNYYFTWKLWSGNSPKVLRTLIVIFATSGLLLVTRYQTAVYLLFPIIATLRLLYIHREEAIRPVTIALPFALTPVALQLMAWKTIYGSYLLFTYGEEGEGFIWNDPAWMKVLFSSNHGLFYWHPILFLGLLFFTAWVIRKSPVGLIWMVSILLTYVVNAAWWCWWLASSFGQRNFEATVLFAMLGMAYLFALLEDRKQLFNLLRVAIIAAIIWNINLTILYSVNIISRNSSVTWTEMISATFELYSLN